MSKKVWILASILVLLASTLVGCGSTPEPTRAPEPTAPPSTEAAQPQEEANLILATTTSTQDSGLLDYLLPDFQNEYNVQVEVIAVGTGQALALGEDGNADVLLVHARAKEDAFMDAGHGVRREDVMYNDFVIVGQPDDPAGIQGMKQASKALARIAEAEAPFVSRGDDSGTHTKEKTLWAEAGIEPAGDWYISAGQGMGAVLTMADEQQAYTLSDRATYLARTLEGTELVILVEGDSMLFNPYGVIAVNPDKSPQIHDDLAQQFIDWLISLPTQEKIAEFGVAEFGAPLFTPDSAAWREAHAGAEQTAGGITLKITGNVGQEVGWTEEEVRAMETMEAQSTNKQGQTETYTGVSINTLLEMAAPAADATTVVFVADDGYTAQVTLAEVQGCADCIVSFRTKGGFSVVMPGFPGNVQVKGVVEIQIQ
jgi:tungstate transport system substrate-binding protein